MKSHKATPKNKRYQPPPMDVLNSKGGCFQVQKIPGRGFSYALTEHSNLTPFSSSQASYHNWHFVRDQPLNPDELRRCYDDAADELIPICETGN